MLSVMVIVCVLILYPLGLLIYQSFTSIINESHIVFTFRHYLKAFSDVRLLKALFNTLYISLVTAIFATLMGSLLAWIVARTNTPLKK